MFDRLAKASPDPAAALCRAALLLALTSLAGMMIVAALRGPWLDEFWTIRMTDPGIAFAEAFDERWATDLHPPLYYAALWVLRQLIPDNLLLLRLGNALPLLILVPTALAWRARRPGDPWAAVLAGLVLSCPYVIAYFAELRSYFAVMAVTAALMVQLRLLRWSARDLAGGDRRLGLLIAITIVVALNLHFIASAAIGLVIAAEFGALVLAGRRRAAALLALASLAGTALAAASLACVLSRTPPFSFFAVEPLAALRMVATGVILGFALNPGVDLAVLSALRRRAFRSGTLWSAAGVVAAAALVLGQSLLSGSLTLKYTLVLVPPAAALAADLAADALARSRLLIGVFLVGGLALQTVAVLHEAANTRWLTLTDRMTATVRACPATRIIGIDQHALTGARRPSVAGWVGVFDVGYQWVAARRGLTITTTREDRDTVITPGPCPTLLWSAHDFEDVPDIREVLRRARVRFIGRPKLTMLTLQDQRLVIVAPEPAPGP